jgi:tetratricopeptide (TPR) repeat protein
MGESGSLPKEAIGLPQEAIQSLQKFIELEPQNAIAHELLGELTAQTSGFENAEPPLPQAIELEPNMSIAWSNRGLSLLEATNSIAEGMECIDMALQIDPFLVAASCARAWALAAFYKAEALDLYNSIPLDGAKTMPWL